MLCDDNCFCYYYCCHTSSFCGCTCESYICFLLGVFLVCCSLGWLGDGFCVRCPLPTLPLGVGARLGNWATHLWHGTRCQSCGLDLGGSRRIACFFSSRFGIHFFVFPCTFLAFPPPLRVAWRWLWLIYLLLPLKAGSSFHPFFFNVLCRLCSLAVQRFGSGF